MMETFTEHRASSFNDGGLWRKLLEKAKQGTTTESYFAADIVVENLATSMFPKLGLPAEFLEHHREKLTENIILEGPDGHKWPVMLGLSWDSKPCLLHGWQEFATDCNLAVNDQILFFLWENSHFLFQVFDSNNNIKRGVCGTSAHIARTTLPQVTGPIQSFGFTTTRPNILSLPSGNNSGVSKNVHKENHTTQDSPSGEKLGNQEPGVEEDDDRVADFNANYGEVVEGFQSAPPSDAEEDQAWSIERTRNLNRKTTGRGGDELHKSIFDPPARTRGSTVSIHDHVKQASVPETDGAPVRKSKEPQYTTEVLPEVLPVKRARQAPTDRSQPVSASTSKRRQARGTKKTSSHNPDSRATKSAPPTWNRLKSHSYNLTLAAKIAQATAAAEAARETTKAAAKKEGEATARAPAANKEGACDGVAARIAEAAAAADRARKAAKAAANKEGEVAASDPVTPMPVEAPQQAFKCPSSVQASDPVTPMPVEAPKQAFKRPQPRNPPRQLYFSKRRPVTQEERLATLEEGQQYAEACYNRVYVMQLTASQVYYGNFLVGNANFAQQMELPLKGHKEVTLYDRSGRTWKTVWYAQHLMRTGLASPGWTNFVLDHFLEEDDVCVFELPDPKASNISVTVFPVVPLNPKPKKWRDHYMVDPPVVPAVVQPEAELSLGHWATLGQSSSFEKEDSEIEGKRRRLIIDLNSKELEMNNSCEEDKSNEKGKRCMEETTTEG